VYTYDEKGRRLTRTFPDGTTERSEYDEVGHVTTLTDGNSARKAQEFDATGRLLRRTFQDGSNESYTYSPTGSLTSATNVLGMIGYTYDTNEQLLRIDNPDGSSVSYTYDSQGNRTTNTTQLAASAPPRVTSHTYDSLNRLASVTDHGGNATAYTYDHVGNLESISYPNGVVTSYSYDSRNRLVLMEHSRNSVVLAQFHYQVNAIGDRVLVTHADGSFVEYEYDNQHRLTREIHKDIFGSSFFDLSYSYDEVGNITSTLDLAGILTEYRYDSTDKLLSVGDTNYSYDANGNQLSRIDDDGLTSYAFDFDNRLMTVDTPTDSVSYGYSPQGDRVQRIAADTTNYLVDPINPTGVAQVLSDYDSTGAALSEYIYGNQLLSQNRSGVNHFSHRDGSQNVRLLTDGGGNVTDTYAYQAFGQNLDQSGSTTNPYRFAGDRVDPSNGLLYLRARYYEPGVGRFISRDPFEGVLRDSMSLHRYLYANNNPVSYVDPTGLVPTTIVEVGFVSALMSVSITGAIITGTAIYNPSSVAGLTGGRIAFKLGTSFLTGFIAGATGAGISKFFFPELAGAASSVTERVVLTIYQSGLAFGTSLVTVGSSVLAVCLSEASIFDDGVTSDVASRCLMQAVLSVALFSVASQVGNLTNETWPLVQTLGKAIASPHEFTNVPIAALTLALNTEISDLIAVYGASEMVAFAKTVSAGSGYEEQAKAAAVRLKN